MLIKNADFFVFPPLQSGGIFLYNLTIQEKNKGKDELKRISCLKEFD